MEDNHRRDQPAGNVTQARDQPQQGIQSDTPPSTQRNQPVKQPRELLDPLFSRYRAR
jgi:hypothetical protein